MRHITLAIIVVSLAAIMLLSGAAFMNQAPAQKVISPPSVSTVNPVNHGIIHIKNPGVPQKYFYPPNMHTQTVRKDGLVTPLYSSSPAPMGIGSWGVMNQSGNLQGYILNTSSFEGSVTVNTLTPFYMDNDGPYSVSMQLNAILTNVTLFGNSSYVFWNQNVLFYSARTKTINFIDNIWNFSSPTAPITLSTFYNYTGYPVVPEYYYAVGPVYNVTAPFTVNLYLNATVIDNRDAVFFNYTVFTGNAAISGSFDRVIFNSTYGMPSSFVTPEPHYMINGFQVTPTGYIPYDAELMIGGPGGGSTSSIYQINATMNLNYFNGKGYVSVPSAYDFGTATGETSEGVAEWWSGSTVHLGAGPSLLYPMWNISQNSGYQEMKGTVNPGNSFIFMNQGPFNETMAAWAPVGQNGQFDYKLPPGLYSGKVMMSEYDPANFIFRSSENVNLNLQKDTSMGIYTPLFAFSNSQLAAISTGGNGTEGNPYVIYNNEYSAINPLFWEFNDFSFPVFPGILIANTNAYVTINHASPFLLYYPQFTYGYLDYFGLPSFNMLQTELYNTSHVSIMNSQFTGWFTSYLSVFPASNLIVWNSTSTLIAYNNFKGMGQSMLMYGGTGNMIFGNYFQQAASVAQPSALEFGSTPIGLSMYSSNNTIINNNFNVYVTVYSPQYSIYYPPGVFVAYPVYYNNTYNITAVPSSTVWHFNGHSLTGSVVNQGFISGNTYWDAVQGYAYNDYGLIASGGDFSPVFPMLYNVTVTVNNMPANSTAYVYLIQNGYQGYLFSSTGSSSITVQAYNGTYYVMVVTSSGQYFSFPNTVNINGANISVNVSI